MSPDCSGLGCLWRGEIYERLGEPEKAIGYYNKFLELWKDADPEVQPLVRDVRARLAKLAGER